MRRTTKKTKVIGTETYINESTGELKEMQVITVEDRDFNFEKLWLSNILDAIEDLGNQKIKLAFWIISRRNSDNLFIMTQREIAKQTGMALQTVNDTLKILTENDILRKVQIGVYQVNPKVIFKGSRCNRLNVLIEYSELK